MSDFGTITGSSLPNRFGRTDGKSQSNMNIFGAKRLTLYPV